MQCFASGEDLWHNRAFTVPHFKRKAAKKRKDAEDFVGSLCDFAPLCDFALIIERRFSELNEKFGTPDAMENYYPVRYPH